MVTSTPATNKCIVHTDEWILMQGVRPDPNAAVTAMTAVGTRTLVDGFGRTHTAPTGYAYLTPTSVGGRGETLTTIQSTPVTIDGSTYTQSMTVSDRTHGPVTGVQTITGTGAATVSWVVNARNHDGQGYGSQPVEAFGVSKPGGVGGLGTDNFSNYNPTRDGDTSRLVTGLPNAPPPQPARDLRLHCGMSVLYRASGDTFETCVIPTDFVNYQTIPDGSVTEKGESATRSVLHWAARQYDKTKLGWGRTAVTRAVCQRRDIWTYIPTEWSPATCGGLDVFASRSCGTMGLGAYWNEGAIYDLAAFGSPIAIPAGVFTQVPSGSGGVDNFQRVSFNRRIATQFDNDGLTVNQVVRSPAASPYAAVYMRNSATDIAMAYCTRLEDLSADDLLQDPSNFVRDVQKGRPDSMSMGSLWDASDVEATVPTSPGGIWGIAYGVNCVANARKAGWLGHVEYRLYGRSAHVLAAMQDLYAAGDLDRRPENYVPGAVNAATYWPNAPLNVSRIKQRVRQMWERTKT